MRSSRWRLALLILGLVVTLLLSAVLYMWGMAGLEGKGRITVSVTRRGMDLVMAIEDDGVGRHAPKPTGAEGAVKKTSLATTITKARLDLVQKQKGRPAGFNYVDLPQGTRVEVSLPIGDPA